MAKETIFVTSAGGDVACAALRCIRNAKEEFFILACDMKEYSQGRMYADQYLISPKYADEEAYQKFIMESCLNYHVTIFLPIAEQEIEIVNRMRGFFLEHKICLMINNEMIIENCLSKYQTFQICKKAGVLVPVTMQYHEYAADNRQLDFPFIMKSDRGCGSSHLKYIENQEQLTHLSQKENLESYVMQECVGTKEEEYTMGVFSDGKEIRYIAFRRKLGFGSMSIQVQTVCDDELQKIAIKLAEYLSLRGSINVQMRKQNGNYYVFEINPRISSSCAFRHLNGFCDVLWWIKLVKGTPIQFEYKPVSGRVGIKTLNEILFDQNTIIQF